MKSKNLKNSKHASNTKDNVRKVNKEPEKELRKSNMDAKKEEPWKPMLDACRKDCVTERKEEPKKPESHVKAIAPEETPKRFSLPVTSIKNQVPPKKEKKSIMDRFFAWIGAS